jgi:hypothetical protein
MLCYFQLYYMVLFDMVCGIRPEIDIYKDKKKGSPVHVAPVCAGSDHFANIHEDKLSQYLHFFMQACTDSYLRNVFFLFC